MSDFKQRIEEYITSSAHLTKKHIHPRLMKMYELGGMKAVFVRGEGQYLWDTEGTRYLDLLAGGGVYFMGRNNPDINQALIDVLSLNIPNLCVVNASILGGVLAGKLLELAGPHFGKVVFANAGSESTEVALRFARQITGRRRFLYLEGAFHGRSFGAISVCGFPQMRENMEPAMPTCSPIRVNDLAQLKRELKMGDVAAFIFEPVQGMTGQPVDAAYLREAEALCEQYGTVLIADEIQCGLARTGEWFVSQAMGVRPGIMTVSKALSGGQIAVGAVLISEDVYERVYNQFGSGLVYFSTFAENNMAMAAGLAAIEVLEKLDAPAEAKRKGEIIRAGFERLAEKYDCIDRFVGMGLMQTIYFKDSSNAMLQAQQAILKTVDSGAFAAAVHVDLFTRQKVIAQIPGPGINAIKVLPPVITTDEDLEYFLGALDDTLASFYQPQTGPIASLTSGVVNSAMKGLGKFLPAGMMPALGKTDVEPLEVGGKKNLPQLEVKGARSGHRAGAVYERADYTGPILDHCDYLIVGSGAAGGTLAWQLAQSGKKVIVVEAGPWVRQANGTILRDMGKTLASYFWDGGMRTTRGNVILPTLQARVLGGGTVFNSAICMRPTPGSLETWRDEHGLTEFTEAYLEPHFQAVEAFFEVKPVTDDIQGQRNLLFKAACDKLGWKSEAIRRNESGCVGSGECILGCRHDAKLSTDRRGFTSWWRRAGRSTRRSRSTRS